MCSQEFDGLRHGALDVDRFAVVPALLEEGNQEVKGHHDVYSEFFVSHGGVTNGAGHAGDLLELKLNRGTDIFNLVEEGFVVRNDLGEHVNSVKNGTNNDWNLLKDSV